MNKKYERYAEVKLKRDVKRNYLMLIGVVIVMFGICYGIEKLTGSSMISNIIIGVTFVVSFFFVKYLQSKQRQVAALKYATGTKNALLMILNSYREKKEFLISKEAEQIDPEYRKGKIAELEKLIDETEKIYSERVEQEEQLINALGE